MGSTGPASINPATGKIYGLTFPVITIPDMVRAQAMLVDRRWHRHPVRVIGGSMGGMQVQQWAVDYPERLFSAVIATASRHSAQNIAFHEVGRQAIMADPDWRGGAYADQGVQPGKGLASRGWPRTSPICPSRLHRKFGRELQRDGLDMGLRRRLPGRELSAPPGASFVDRFDANSYLYITRAMDYFDIAADHGGVLAKAFTRARDVRFCLMSFTSDWLYPTAESRHLVRALTAAGARVPSRDRERQGPRRLPAGRACNCWKAAASTAAASNCRARASTAVSAKASQWCRATPIRT
jgi:homoserine O-acetyltransferase